ncbi:hypothetical protein JCM33374_g2493 [Metschnikowia sp. JCM 33374]|nr:hypothetical protein JCM33374_g2493 [Metschnikowia sp. JCM 33374]
MKLTLLLSATTIFSVVTSSAILHKQAIGSNPVDPKLPVGASSKGSLYADEGVGTLAQSGKRDLNTYELSRQANYLLEGLFLDLKWYGDSRMDQFDSEEIIRRRKDILPQLSQAYSLVYQVGGMDIKNLPDKRQFVDKVFQTMDKSSALIHNLKGSDGTDGLRKELYQIQPCGFYYFNSLGVPNNKTEGYTAWLDLKTARVPQLKEDFKKGGLSADDQKVVDEEFVQIDQMLQLMHKRAGRG